MSVRVALIAGLTAVVTLTSVLRGQEEGPFARPLPEPVFADAADPVELRPTNHPNLPVVVAEYWLVSDPSASRTAKPPAAETAKERFARGAKLIAGGNFAAGLPLVSAPELSKTSLAAYAQFYTAVALISLSRLPEADTALTAAASSPLTGSLEELVPTRLSDVALVRSDPKRAVALLSELTDKKLLSPDEVLLRLARAAERGGDMTLAVNIYRKLYYEYPLSTFSGDAQSGLSRLQTAETTSADRVSLDRKRAEALYAARRWAAAKTGFESLAADVEGDEKAALAIRIAACDYYLNRFRASRDSLAPYLEDSPRAAEARFFYLSSTRGLGDKETYVRLARKLVEDFPSSPWAEETLNNLATHYITEDDDAEADLILRQLVKAFPKGRYTERAAHRIGWGAYRAGQFAEAADIFERAAAAFPRADNRPAWLYWSGRAREQLDQRALAASRYALTVADYQNSYYGRLADKLLEKIPDRLLPARLDTPSVAAPRIPPVPTDGLIRELVSLELYDDALREVQFAQRKWGDSPQLQATSAFIRHNQGLSLKAEERFAAVRGAITAMRRAYPQFMAAGGEKMPDEVLRIIFPLDYWSLITKYSTLHDLDPYLVAALMAQESTFTAEIRSSANAYGLMQLIPSTGRRYARKLGIRNFSTASLRNPETNVRLGTEYFKDLMQRFGSAHYALAGYNAGESRVQRWIDERPTLPADEFVEEIPFSETQNYVKRILGTADDYRRLYGVGRLDPNAPLAVPGPVTAAPKTAAAKKPAAKATTGKTPAAKRPATKKPATNTPAKKPVSTSARTSSSTGR